jgi:hypothetical protein
MKNNVASIEQSETTRECLNDDGLGGVRALAWAVVIEVVISMVAIVAWFRFR